MAFVIAEPCIGVKDGACAVACPVDCIQGSENSPQMYVNPNECIDCGCCELACPVGAIVSENEVPAKWRHFIELNAAYFK